MPHENLPTVRDVLSAERYADYLGRKPRPLQERYKALSDDQIVAVYAYTTDEERNSYADINCELLGRNIDSGRFSLVQAINAAINSIEKDRSAEIYYRYTRLKPEQVERFYTPKRIACHSFFTSVSARNANFIADDCNVLVRVLPGSAIRPAYIAGLSNAPYEEEYLYPPNSYFQVLQVIQLADNAFDIALLER